MRKNRRLTTELMKTMAHHKSVLVLFLLFTSTISGIYAQQLVPLSPRADATQNRLSGNLVMTGNGIVGLVDSDNDNVTYDPNAAYNGNFNNGNSTTAYINIDGDPTTFSSSSADIDTPRPACTEIVYAGLYWTATYYLVREGETTLDFTVNNTPIAGSYNVTDNTFNPGNVPVPAAPGITGDLVLVIDDSGSTDGCDDPLQNAAAVNGNIAIIRRGSCQFVQKVINAQNAGAIAVIIVNDRGGNDLPPLGGGNGAITIPTVGIEEDDGEDIIAQMNSSTVNVTLASVTDTSAGDEQLVNLPAQDARKVGDDDFRSIKFRVPGGTYVDITPDQIIYDGYANTPTNQARDTSDIDDDGDTTEFIANDDVPYVCYANVTSLIDQNNTNGTYTVANMNATIGRTSGVSGASGGWVLVVIYEDPLESSKFISTNDGFVQIRSSQPDVDFTYTGFTSLPAPLPVTVRYGVATLEGDKDLGGDQLQLQNTGGIFVPLGQGTNTLTDINPTNNFFNSSVTFNNNHILTRNPPSTNTLGMDIDLFDLNNFGNTLIGNDQMSATFRLSTVQDTYRVFLNAFVIDIIEPELRIVKSVFQTDGTTQIPTNDPVTLGQEVFYDLAIENVGNEDLVDGTVTITDILPANMNLLGVQDATLPPGVTYTETTPGTLVFNIPASIVEEDDSPITIRFRAQLVTTCEELRDACSNVIRNSAIASFTGAISGALGTNNSVAVIGPCGNNSGESTNILANVPPCSSDVTFCNDDLFLVAGTGYDQYTWTGPGIPTPVVTSVNSYQVPNPQTGVYQVVKEDTNAADGTCMTLTELFNVEDFRDIVNPVLDYVNGTTVVTELCSGLQIPQILLCGDQTLLLETNFDAANLDSISWQQLSAGGSCALDPNDPCSLLDADCNGNWAEVVNGNTASYTVSEAGDYRILAVFDGGCQIPFYFSVYKNDYQPDLDMSPIECGNDGSVTVVNVPANFAFSLVSGGPYNNTTGVFTIPPGSGGDVTVYAIDTTFPGCEYTETINVPEINPSFVVTGTNPSCINDDNGTGFGTIQIAVTGGLPEYQYTISGGSLTSPIIVPNSSANNGNYIQDNLPAGTYMVEVITNRPSPECLFSTSITIDPAPDFDAEVVLIAPETCESGAMVQINVLNGSGTYFYDDGTGNFQTNNVFEIPRPANPGTTYTFFVSDGSLPAGTPACIISASIDNITPYEPIVIDDVTVTQPACPGDSGQIRVQVSPQVAGRIYTYRLLDTSSTDPMPPVVIVDEITSVLRDITFANIAPGVSYTVEVLHNNTTPPGTTPPVICPVQMGTYAINPPGAITADVTLERSLSCIVGSEDALIRIDNIAGGSGTYEWSFDNVSFTNITTVPTDVPVSTAGSYTIYIRNQATGDCAVPFDIIVPDLLEVDDLTFVNGDNNCANQTTVVTFDAAPVLTAAEISAGVIFEYEVTPDPASGAAATGSVAFNTTNSYTFTQGVVYTVTARRSDSQCTYSEDYTVDPIDQIEITSANQTNPVTCRGGNNGAFSFTVDTTLFTTFDYEITGPAPATTVVASGTSTTSPVTIESPATPLVAGTYTITVTDPSTSATDPTANCSDTTTVTITEPVDDVTFTLDLDQTCTTNTVTVTNPMGANGPTYTATLTHPTNGTNLGPQATNLPFENVPNGTGYEIIVTDSQGCTSAPQTLDINALPMVAANISASELCLDDSIATLTIDITSGTPGTAPDPLYTYTITRDGTQIIGTTNVTAIPFTTPNLTQDGTYVVRITDSVGCFVDVTQVIEPAVTITATRTKDITCDASGNPDAAQVDFTVTGGYTPYDIDFTTDGGTTFTNHITDGTAPYATFTTTTAGTYQFRVTDNEGCIDLSLPIEITDPVGPTITADPVNVACFGDLATAIITVAGTDPSYEIDFGNTGTFVPMTSSQVQFPDLAAATYNFTIMDSRGCTYPGSVVVSQPDEITAVVAEVDITCNDVVGGGNILGSITLTLSGGTPAASAASYTYAVTRDGAPFVIAPTFPAANQALFSSLDFGFYEITVTDANDCSRVFSERIDNVISGLSFNAADINGTCPGGFDLEINIVGGSGVITVPLPRTVPGFRVEIVGDATSIRDLGDDGGAPAQPITTTTYNALAYGISYTILITDLSNMCTFQEEFIPIPPSAPVVTVTGTTDVTCDEAPALSDGTVTFSVAGYDAVAGQAFVWEVLDRFDFTNVIDSGGPVVATADPQVIGPVGNLPEGRYVIRVTEQAGTMCPGISTEFVIESPDPLNSVAAPVIPANCNEDAQVTITSTGGTAPYTYALVADGAGSPVNVAANYPLTGVINLGNTVQDLDIWTRDANGCLFGPIDISVLVTPDPTITAPAFANNPCDLNDFVVPVTSTATATNVNGNIFYAFDDATDPVDPIVFVEGPVGNYTYTIPNPGTYNLTVRDANGCEDVDQIIIYPPVDVSVAIAFDCIDGDITVTATGGSGNYEYVLLDNVGGTVRPQQVSNQFLAVPSGDYTVQVLDTGMAPAPGCPFTAPASIGTPITPILLTTGVTDVTCFGGTDGSITASIDPTTVDPAATYTYEITAPIVRPSQTSPIFTGLPQGTYTVVVTATANAVSCTDDESFTIGEPAQVTATAVQGDQFDCDGTTNATIIIDNITGGTGPDYTVTVTQPDGVVRSDIPVVFPLPFSVDAPIDGTYQIEVFDSNNCPLAAPIPVDIIPLVPLSNPAVNVTQDITCPLDEIVEVSVQGGSGDYLFERIDNAGTAVDAIDTPAGTSIAQFFTLPRDLGIYTFRITDQGDATGLGLGCTINVTHEIDEFDFIEVVAAQQTPESCFGDADGTISITITGYTGTFDFLTYESDGVTTVAGATGSGNATSDPFTFTLPTPFAQGAYIIEVTETAAPNCVETSNVVTVVGPAAPIVVQLSPINLLESCIPGSDGSFQAIVTGAQGVVNYTIAPPAQPANTTGLFENLPAGTYTVTATDANMCTDDETIDIIAPNPILVDPIADSSVTCFGDSDGTITISANGGQGPGTYLYTLTFPDGTTTSGPQASNVFNNLGAGTYTITVSDNLACSATTTAIINEPNEVTASIDTVTDVECGLDTVNVTISGTSDVAITQYYSVDQNGIETPNGGSGSFIGLGAGEYQFFVEDANGCRSQLVGPVPVIPINPITIVLDERFANVNCTDDPSGLIDATVSGGLGDYVFELTNNTTAQTWGPQATSQFGDLPPGLYTYLVRTDRNCVAQENFEIVNPPLFERIDPDATDVVCFGEDNGQIVVFASGGSGLYSFAISTDPDQFFNDASDDVPNQHTFTMLAPGTYDVFAQDSRGCGERYTVTIMEPTQLMANVVGTVTPETCLGDSDGAATIEIINGVPPYFTNITNNDADFVQDQLTYMNLPGGTTTIYIRDSNDCRLELPVVIPEGVILNADLMPRLECPEWDYSNPEAPVLNQGPQYFVTFVLTPDSETVDIMYSLTGINGTDPTPITNTTGIFEVTPGEYQGSMEHINGCIEQIGDVLIEEYIPLTIPTAQMTGNSADPNEYEIIVTGGNNGNVSNYTYYFALLPNGIPVDQLPESAWTELPGNIFTIRQTADYGFRVVDDSGCEVLSQDELTYINIRIPNYFTPDRDDPSTDEDERFWYPRQILSPNFPNQDEFFFGDIQVRVFDRYGRLLEEFTGDTKGWDGIYKGKPLPSGDYWYTVLLNDIDNREFTGHFTLYR